MRGSDWMGVAMLSHVTMIIAIMSLRWYYQHNTSKACEESQYFSWKAPEQHAVYLETKEGLTARAKGHTLCEFLWLGSVPTVSWAGSMAPESWVLCFGCWIYAFFSILSYESFHELYYEKNRHFQAHTISICDRVCDLLNIRWWVALKNIMRLAFLLLIGVGWFNVKTHRTLHEIFAIFSFLLGILHSCYLTRCEYNMLVTEIRQKTNVWYVMLYRQSREMVWKALEEGPSYLTLLFIIIWCWSLFLFVSVYLFAFSNWWDFRTYYGPLLEWVLITLLIYQQYINMSLMRHIEDENDILVQKQAKLKKLT